MVTKGINSDKVAQIKININAIVNNGIISKLAIIEIIFNVLKKYAIINISAIIVERLIDKLSASFVGILVLCIILPIEEFKRDIPKTQEKLIKNPTSKADSGFIKKIITPAIEIDVKESYSLNRISESINISDIILALIIDVAKLQM